MICFWKWNLLNWFLIIFESLSFLRYLFCVDSVRRICAFCCIRSWPSTLHRRGGLARMITFSLWSGNREASIPIKRFVYQHSIQTMLMQCSPSFWFFIINHFCMMLSYSNTRAKYNYTFRGWDRLSQILLSTSKKTRHC